MLDNFFRINLPYGIGQNKNGEWMAFNREYMPLGYNDYSLKRGGHPRESFNELPIYTSYKGLTEKFLLSLAADESSITRDDKGNIITVYFYKDSSNPVNVKDNKALWESYFDKLKRLSTKQVTISNHEE